MQQEKQQYLDEMEIDLREIFEILKKNVKILIAIPLIAVFLSGIVSFFMLTPIYEASRPLSLVVNPTFRIWKVRFNT